MSKRKISSEGIIFVVSAPSGTGKTTLVTELLMRDRRLRKTVSHTTRPRRPGERNGKDYTFVSKAVFERMIRKGELLEWARVYGDYYGTSQRTIHRCLQGGHDAVLVIEARGGRAIRRHYKDRAVFIVILPPSLKALRDRMKSRKGSTAKDVATRLSKARRELERLAWYEYAVTNERISSAVGELAHIISAERNRLRRQRKALKALL